MSAPIARSSGSLSTNGTAVAGTGLLTYAEAVGGTLVCYEGSTSGEVLATIPSSGRQTFTTPVQFSGGLWVTISAGTATIHSV